MSSDSDDDAPLALRGSTKGAAGVPMVKKEQGGATKPVAVKAEVKEEPREKGPQGKEHKVDAKAKGEEKKPVAAKGKVVVKEEEPAQNGKATAASKKVKEEGKQPREKKEFDMPGQTRDPPPETDSLRKFYTSLLEQRPESEIAKKWCLMHGLLSREAAEELVAQLRKSKPMAKSPAKMSARPEGKSAATKARRPAEKVASAKRQRQAVSPPPNKTRAKYSDEEDESSSRSEDDDDDDEPIGRVKSAAKAAPKAGPAGKKPRGRPIKSLNKAFVDGGLDDSDDDDEDNLPLIPRKK